MRFFRLRLFVVGLGMSLSLALKAQDESFGATVLGKLYPRERKFELTLPVVGLIPNQSYIDSMALAGQAAYHFTERWGVQLEGSWVFNYDREERYCLEHFYNDADNSVVPDCPERGDDITAPLKDQNGNSVKGANFGPIYVPVRELKSLLTASALWNPVYGKQIAFLSFVSHFDLFLLAGGGMAVSDFYPESQYLKNGTISHGNPPADFEGGCPTSIGICPLDARDNYLDMIGESGRPESVREMHPVVTFGVGQRFHFLKHWLVKAELRNFTLYSADLGVEAFYMLSLGTGVRF